MGSAVGEHDLAHDEDSVLAGAVRVNCDWLEDTVGVAPLGLLGGRTIKSPLRKVLKGRELVEFLDAALGAKIWNGRVAVQPDVIESVFCHLSDFVWWSLGSSGLECRRLESIKLAILRKGAKQVSCQVLGHPEAGI